MDKKKLDQRIVAIYTVFGAAAALVANYLNPLSTALALILPFAAYLATLAPIVKGKGKKEKQRIILNSFLTLFLVWATVWIFFFNL